MRVTMLLLAAVAGCASEAAPELFPVDAAPVDAGADLGWPRLFDTGTGSDAGASDATDPGDVGDPGSDAVDEATDAPPADLGITVDPVTVQFPLATDTAGPSRSITTPLDGAGQWIEGTRVTVLPAVRHAHVSLVAAGMCWAPGLAVQVTINGTRYGVPVAMPSGGVMAADLEGPLVMGPSFTLRYLVVSAASCGGVALDLVGTSYVTLAE